MRRPADIVDAAMSTALVVIVVGLIAIWGALAYDIISTSNAQSHCGALGGRVEHYDPQHADLWRCVGARAEGE